MAVVLYAPALALEAGRIIMAIGRCVWGGRLVLGFLGGFIHFADNSLYGCGFICTCLSTGSR